MVKYDGATGVGFDRYKVNVRNSFVSFIRRVQGLIMKLQDRSSSTGTQRITVMQCVRAVTVRMSHDSVLSTEAPGLHYL